MAYDIGPRIGIQGEAEFNKQIKQINNALRECGSEMKALSSEFEDNANSQDALIAKNKNLAKEYDLQRQKMNLLQDQYEKQTVKLNELAQAYQKAKNENGEMSKEAAKAENAFNRQAETVSKLSVSINETQNFMNRLDNAMSKNDKTLDEIASGARGVSGELLNMGKNADTAGNNLEELEKKLDAGNLMQASENLQGVSDKLIEVGQAAMDSATEWDSAQAKMQANLGLTEEETQKLGEIAQSVFEQGIADSVDTASEAVMLCKQNFEDLNDTDLENLSGKLVGIAERTGTDLQENIRGADQLMTAFGIDGQYAMDLIAAGYQANLNSSGDFMDTLNEYAPLFSEAGFSAEQMLSILSSGMENGALNTDKVADAVKELQVRMGDGTFEQNMGMFSESTQNLFREWKDGGATVAEVAESIGQDLQKMTPTEQQQALSALSTQFEDLGIDASVALLNMGNEFTNVTGKAQEFSNATPSEKWQGSLNKISDSLADIGTNIMETLQPALEFVAGLAERFAALPGPLQTIIVVIGILITAFVALAPAISAVMTIVTALSTVALAPMIPIIAAVAAAITAIILVIQNWGAITEWLGGVWEAIKTKLSEIWNSIKETASNVFTAIKDFLVSIWEAIKSAIGTAVNAIKTVVTTAWNAIKTGITTIVNAIKTVITTVWNAIKNVVTTVTNSIKNGAVNGFKSLVNGIKGAVSGVSNIIQNAFDAAINFITSLPGKALQWGRDFINGLKDGIMAGVNGIVSAVKGIGDKIRSFLHFSRPDEGPLRDYEKWMPDFMTGLANGIYDNIDKVQKAASAVSGTIDSTITGRVTDMANNVPSLGGGMIVVDGDTITLDGKAIGKSATKYITYTQAGSAASKGRRLNV